MPAWATFAAFVGVFVAVLLFFTRVSRRTLERATVVTDRSEPGISGGTSPGDDTRSTDDSAFTSTVDRTEERGDSDSGVVCDSNDSTEHREGRDQFTRISRSPSQKTPETSDDVANLVQSSTQTRRQIPDTPTVQPGQSADDPEDRPSATQGASATPAETGEPGHEAESESESEPYLTTRELYATVVVSQGLLLVVLGIAVWMTDVPVMALGIDISAIAAETVGIGLVTGIVFSAGNEIAAAAATRVGVTPSTDLREALAPDTTGRWVILLVVVLPVIAVFEEMLFRGALIGALAGGFDISPWILAAGSSVAFGLGHGAQGRTGIVVTGLLGFGLASVFIISGSLTVVVIAHYVVNVLEFGVREAAS